MEERKIYFYNEVGDCYAAVEFTEKQWPHVKRLQADHATEFAALKSDHLAALDAAMKEKDEEIAALKAELETEENHQ